MILKKILATLLTRPIWWSLHNYKVLSLEYGQIKTMRRRECIDKDDKPIPWYTYPAIEFLKQIDFTQKTIFEYGSGNSTLFWAERCKTVVAVEDNDEWYAKLRGKLPANVDYLLLKDKEEYTSAVHRYPFLFDIIAIDGSHRYECSVAARSRLRDDGLVILDNSDWREQTSRVLRESDLIEVDMSGFGPINPYTWTTSLYLTRKVDLKPGNATQPIHGVGSVHLTEADQRA